MDRNLRNAIMFCAWELLFVGAFNKAGQFTLHERFYWKLNARLRWFSSAEGAD